MMFDVPKNRYPGRKIPNRHFETGFKIVTLHLRLLFALRLRNIRLQVSNTLLRNFELVQEIRHVPDEHETRFLGRKWPKEQF